MNEQPLEETPQDQTVMVTRVFNAPRELVFKAWTDPKQVARWWGPEGFHTPPESVEIELRAGGRFHLDMVQDEDGAQFPAHFEIVEMAAPELLVLKGEPMPEMGMPEPTVTRIELQADGDKTRMVLTEGPYTAMMREQAEPGWTGSLDKLDALLRRA